MKVRMRVSMEGAESRPAGSVCDVSNAEAKRLFEAGFAEPVRSVGVERATAPEAEKAVTRSRPAKKKAKKK